MNKQIVIFISLLTILSLGIFLIWPKYQTLKEIQLKVSEKKTELQYKEEYFANLEKISQELEKYKEELAKINSALPEDPSLPTLYNFLEKASSQNGLILKKIGDFSIAPLVPPQETTTQEAASGEIKEIRLGFEVAGSYSALKNFLATLEKSARLIEVEVISFSSPKAGENLFSFELTIKTYSY